MRARSLVPLVVAGAESGGCSAASCGTENSRGGWGFCRAEQLHGGEKRMALRVRLCASHD